MRTQHDGARAFSCGARRTALLAQPVLSVSLMAEMRAPFCEFVKFEKLTVLNVKRTKRKIQFLLTPQLLTRGYHYPEVAGLSSDRALICQLRSGAVWGYAEKLI